MKKSLLCLALAASIASVGVQAQDKAGGSNAFLAADGSVKAPVVAAAATAVVITAGLVTNANGSAPIRPVVPPPPPPPLTCNGDDEEVDGVCINNTVTTTVTGTGTATSTITVPVSSTYAPTN